MSWRFARAVHTLLTGDKVSERWTTRTQDALGSLRNQYEFLRPEADVVVSDREMGEVRWFTFAGGIINTAFSDVIRAHGFDDVVVSDFWVRAAGTTDGPRMVEAVQSKEAIEVRSSFQIADEFLDNLKFNECLPADLAHEILRERLVNLEDIQATVSRAVVEVVR